MPCPTWKCAKPDKQPPRPEEISYHKYETYSAWDKCAELVAKRENEQVEAWKNEVENLLQFAGTFLTVNTLFIDASSGALQPNDARITVEVLYTISRQLNGTHAVATPEPFERELLDVIQCSFIFASLLLSLIAAGLGLWVKEWLCEYLLDLPNSPRELVHVREFRHRGIHGWHMRQHVSAISLLLNLAIALFSVGLMLYARKIDLTLSFVVSCLLGLWQILTWVTAFIPAIVTSCPYRAPFSRGLDSALTWIARCLCNDKQIKDLITREREEAKGDGPSFEVRALEYINREYWGHKDLPVVNRCFKDVDSRKARKAIQDIIMARMTTDASTFVDIHKDTTRSHELDKLPSDKDVLVLLRIWGSSHVRPSQSSITGNPGPRGPVDAVSQSTRNEPLSDECAGQTAPSFPEYPSTPNSASSGQTKQTASASAAPVKSDLQLWNEFKGVVKESRGDAESDPDGGYWRC